MKRGFQLQRRDSAESPWQELSPIYEGMHEAISEFERQFPDKTLKDLKVANGLRIAQFDGKGRFPLAWPSGWKRTHPTARSRNHRYGVTPEKAIKNLLNELRRFGAIGQPIISTNVERKRDGQPYANMSNPSDPENLIPHLSVGMVEGRFRELSPAVHPDRGGSEAAFKELTRARDEARTALGARSA